MRRDASAATPAPASSSSAAAAPVDRERGAITLDDDDDDDTGTPLAKVGIFTRMNENTMCKCLVTGCGYEAFQKSRFVKHLRTHKDVRAVAAVRAYDEAASAKAAKRAKRDDARVSATRPSGECTDAGAMLKLSMAQKELNRVAVDFVLEAKMPLSITESPAFLALVDGVLKVGRSSPLVGAAGMFKRTAFSARVKETATTMWRGAMDNVVKAAARGGCVLALDGRSNIAQDPMLFFGVSTSLGYTLLGGVNAGAEKKDATFLARLIKGLAGRGEPEYAELIDTRLQPNIYATIQDNAFAPQHAARLVEEDDEVALVALNCALHGVALYPAWLARRIPLVERLLREADHLTSFVRKRPRVKTLIKELAVERNLKATVLLRMVPTRMMLSTMVLGRALAMQHVIREAFSGEAMVTYRAELDTDGKAQLDMARRIINSSRFWSEAQFFVNATTPIYKMLRYLDRDDARSYDVRLLLERGSDSLAAALGNETHDSIDAEVKLSFVEVFQELWARIECDGHVASYMMDPENHKRLHALATSKDPDDKADFLRDLGPVCSVGRTIIKRARVVNPGLVEKLEAGKDMCENLFEREIAQYYYSPATTGIQFVLAETLDKVGFWDACPLPVISLVGAVLMSFPASTGPLERSLKINAGIHTSARASLSTSSVDMLTKGFIAHSLVLKPVDEAARKAWFEAFDRLSDADEAAAERYHEQVAALDKTTETSVRQARTVGEEAGAGARVEDDESESDDEAEPLARDEEPEPEAEPEPAGEDEGPRRPERAAKLTKKLREALAVLRKR